MEIDVELEMNGWKGCCCTVREETGSGLNRGGGEVVHKQKSYQIPVMPLL